jgi:hypothetical protein
MRRGVGLVAAVLAVSVLGCSSGDAITIEVLYPASVYGEQVIESVPFRTLGADIDDTVLCESGTTTRGHLESPEGEIITLDEAEELYEAAWDDGGVVDLYSVQEFVCDDGTGTFVLKVHTRGDSAKPFSEQDIPTWEVESGTGDYTDLSGSGEVPKDLGGASPNETDEIVGAYVGEVQTG